MKILNLNLVFRSLIFALFMMTLCSSLSNFFGVVKTFPTTGGIICGCLSFFHWQLIDREFFK